MNQGQSALASEHAMSGDTRRHFRGLDGLRGVAVLMVLLFHQGYGWAKGGFLGVSMFFTLSGFLITTLLLAEHSRTGRIALGPFLARRARRLAPAAVTVALVIAVVWLVVEGNTASPSIGPDLMASLFKVTNWWFIVDEQSYGDLFAAPSPYLHYWSLAIEEQLYVLWPLALMVILRLRSSAGRVAVSIGVLVVCVAFTFIHESFDLIYYGTHVRAAELLAGGVLALAVTGRTERLAATRTAATATLSRFSWLVLAVLVAGVITQGQSSSLWRNGGLAAVGVLSAVVVAGAIVPGFLRSLLSHPVPVWLGNWSYGIYLVHWPIFVLVTTDRTGLPGWSIFPVRLAATVVAAVALGRLVEQPIRFRRVLRRPLIATATYAVALATGVGVAVVVATTVADDDDEIVASGPQIFINDPAAETDDDGGTAGGLTPVTVPPPTPLTVLVVGSTNATRPLTAADDLGITFVDARLPGCPLVEAVEVVDGEALADLTPCPPPSSWSDALSRSGADAVLVTVGRPDTDRVRVRPDEDVLNRFETRGHVLNTLRNAVRDLRGTDVPILFLPEPELEGTRLSAVEEIVQVVAATDPWARAGTAAESLDAATWIRTTLDELLGTGTSAERLLVLGDSTGASLSRIIFEETQGRQETVGLAEEGCPLIPVFEIRWWGEVGFDLDTCPTIADIRSYVETFQPSALLMSSSLMEQAELRVEGGDWFEPTSPDYVALHDLYMAELQQAFAESSLAPIIWVLDSPPVTSGAFSGSPMARPERIAAWNAQIDRWAATWVNVRRLAWTDALLGREATEGSIRADGVHIDQDNLRRLAQDFLIPALADDREVRREMRANGCVSGAPSVDVDRCRR